MKFSPLRPAVLSRVPRYDDDYDPLWDDEDLTQEISLYEMSMEGTPSKPPRQRIVGGQTDEPHVNEKSLEEADMSQKFPDDTSRVSTRSGSDLSMRRAEEWEGTLNRLSVILDQCHVGTGPVKYRNNVRKPLSVNSEPRTETWDNPVAEVEGQLKKENIMTQRESQLMAKIGDDRLRQSEENFKRRGKRNSIMVDTLIAQWEAERREEERLERERLEKERLERERLEKERLEKERLEKERLEKERLEKERLEKERLEKERLEKERLAKEKAEKERLAKEKAEKEEKERLEAEELAKKKKEGQFTNWRAVDKEFLAWKAKIEEIKKDIKEPVANNAEIKKLCNKCKRQINPKFGQLTHNVAHTKKISSEFEQVFNDAKGHSELVYLWLLNFFAKSIVRQAENETIVAPQSALPLGMLAAKIMSVFPELKDLLIARFVKKCPYVIGFTCDIETEEGRRRMAWRKPNDKWEDETVYSERMGGIASVFAAITQVKFTPPVENPIPISHSWTMMARLINTSPEKLTNSHFTVAASWWEVCGTRFLAAYGLQGQKLLQAAWDAWTSSCTEKRYPAAARLRLLGEEWKSTGKIKGLPPMVKQ